MDGLATSCLADWGSREGCVIRQGTCSHEERAAPFFEGAHGFDLGGQMALVLCLCSLPEVECRTLMG